MTVNARALLEAKYAEDSQTTQYTSTGVRTIIDKATVTNVTASPATFAVNIVASGGSASAANLIAEKTLAADECYTLPEIVGQILNAGDFISTIAGTASALVIRLSGRQIS